VLYFSSIKVLYNPSTNSYTNMTQKWVPSRGGIMDSTYEVTGTLGDDACVLFVHLVDGKEVVSSRNGGQWLPKKSEVLGLVDFAHRQVTFIGGATINYPYGIGKGLYWYDPSSFSHCLTTLKEYIDFLFKEWDDNTWG